MKKILISLWLLCGVVVLFGAEPQIGTNKVVVSPNSKAAGDTLYWDGTNYVRMALGTAGQVPTVGTNRLYFPSSLTITDTNAALTGALTAYSGTFTNRVLAGVGSVAAPGFAFLTDLDTGLIGGSGTLQVVVDGAAKVNFGANNITFASGVDVGTAAFPANTGFFDSTLTVNSLVSTGAVIIAGVNAITTANISDTAYGSGWNGDTTNAPSKDAVYDKIESLVGSVGTNWSAYATGTAYSFTTTPALLDFGTTDPTITIAVAGVYAILANVGLKYTGATFAANQTCTVKLRRINNTPADITSGSRVVTLGIVSTVTGSLETTQLPPIFYTASAGDTLQIFGSISVAPSLGSFDADSAEIVAFRIQ